MFLDESKEYGVYQLPDIELCIRFKFDALNLSFDILKQPDTFAMF